MNTHDRCENENWDSEDRPRNPCADAAEELIEQLPPLLLEAIKSGATLKQVYGVPNDLMVGLYAHAYRFYEQGKLAEAEAFFSFLCLYDFYNAEYAMGLAAVLHMKKEYQKAMDVYALGFALGAHDYRAMFHVGQCNLSLRKPAKAQRCFELVFRYSDDEELRQRACIYHDAVKKPSERSSAHWVRN